MTATSSIRSEIHDLKAQIEELESDLWDAEDAESTLERIAKLLRCKDEEVEAAVKRTIAIVEFFDEIGVPDDLSIIEMNAIRDAVREALAK